jgi:hypothetical protein
MLLQRLTATNATNANNATNVHAGGASASAPVPPPPPDLFPSSAPPPPLLLAHLGRYHPAGAATAAGAAGAVGAASAADWALVTAAWRALHGGGCVSGGSGGGGGGGGADGGVGVGVGVGVSVGVGGGGGGGGGVGAYAEASSSAVAAAAHNPSVQPVPLTGTGDPCWIEATHASHPASRALTVTLRCRPPPASNAPNAQGAAAATLAGVLRVGLHGPCALADGAAAIVAHLGSSGDRRAEGDTAEQQKQRHRMYGHTVRTTGAGSEEETTVEVTLRVLSFGEIAVRPVVSYEQGKCVLCGDPYKVPLTALLTPARMSLAAFQRLWGMLPAAAELAVTVAPHAAAAAAAAAKGGGGAAAGGGGGAGGEGGGGGGVASNGADAALTAAMAALGCARALSHAGGYPLGSSGGACECLAAVTWWGWTSSRI